MRLIEKLTQWWRRAESALSPAPTDMHQVAIDTLMAMGTPRSVGLAKESLRSKHRKVELRREMTGQGRVSTRADDAAVLRMLCGATFGPGARLVLPTGRVLTGNEVALWVDVENTQDTTEVQ